ncbi:MAG: TraB/GumN family protein, partial [Chitinophagaceae bacterium]
SLLWEIRGKGLQKPSYLFGTMHVSSKMAFNLSDSFYLGIKNAQVVALETNPGTWQEDFSRYDMERENLRGAARYGAATKGFSMPQDYLSINSLKLTSYEKMMEAALYSNPSIINNFLYRSNSETSSDFEEDTYLDLHIFQAGRKLGKKVCGVEDFDGSMKLVREAYTDAAKEKAKKQKSYDLDEGLSYRNMEEAYRTGNLDLLDTINKANSQSAAFDEKFLFKRNEIQAFSIDSILKKGQSLFVGVGAAHLPGERGVIEMLRRMGYTLRPIKMRDRDSQHKDAIEKIRVPVQFAKQTSSDGFYSVHVPGKLFRFARGYSGANMEQYADMINGSYYMVSRIFTNAAIVGHNEAQVERKIDSVLYENIPGKILSKKAIVKNGYKGFDISNRTRRGDHQRYNIFITPFEIIIFKMSGNGEYVRLGTEANQFFNSIQLKKLKPGWKKIKPSYGGFEVELPHDPFTFKKSNWFYAAYDATHKTAYEIIRTDVHNYQFLEEDSFDLNLMEESLGSSEFVQRQLEQKPATVDGYPALDVKYKFKDSSMAFVRFLINGPRYYTLIAKADAENKSMQQFVNSFHVKPFVYGEAKKEVDTALYFTVRTSVPLSKPEKLSIYPETIYDNNGSADDDDSLIDNGTYVDKVIANDSTGERIYVNFYKNSAYYYNRSKEKNPDSLDVDDDWVIRKKQIDSLDDKTKIFEYELGSKKSSRYLKAKAIEKNGFGYQLQTELDTLSKPSSFITSFFESFAPVDTVRGIDTEKKKTALFFSQFFSQDSMLHKTALKNIHNVWMDSSDYGMLCESIEALSWKEKKYIDVKKEF